MNIAKMMKNLQKMQGQMQEKIDQLECEGQSGGGMVKVKMNGKKEVLSVQIAPEAAGGDDRELLEDLIAAAFNDAGRQIDAEVQGMTQGMAAGLNLPGMP